MKKLAIFSLLLLPVAAVCLGKSAPPIVTPRVPNSLKPVSYQWAKQKWDTNEAPYKKARAEVENKMRQTKDLAQLSRKLRGDFNDNSKSKVALYRWAYANNEAQKRFDSTVEARNFAQPVLTRLRKTGLPPNYQTMRLRFFLESRGKYPLALKGLAERLLKRNPKDDAVQFYYARILAGDYITRSARKRGLEYALKFAQEHPNDFKSYHILAQAYSWQWQSGDDLSAVGKESDARRKYLQLRPNTPHAANDREVMEEQIRVNQKYETLIKQGKFKPDPALQKP